MEQSIQYREEKIMEPSGVLDLKAFVPAKDYDLAKQFYLDLGFTLNWSNEQISEFQIGTCRFLLQRFYVKDHAGNFMMSLSVEDADEWWAHIEKIGLKAKYPGIMAKPPAVQPWGLRVLYLSDPTGVLWHISDGRSE
jgi:predicted enzyme related to lactoylglutathione lyase